MQPLLFLFRQETDIIIDQNTPPQWPGTCNMRDGSTSSEEEKKPLLCVMGLAFSSKLLMFCEKSTIVFCLWRWYVMVHIRRGNLIQFKGWIIHDWRHWI